MCQIDKDRVGLAGFRKFMVVNIETRQIEVEISEINSREKVLSNEVER